MRGRRPGGWRRRRRRLARAGPEELDLGQVEGARVQLAYPHPPDVGCRAVVDKRPRCRRRHGLLVARDRLGGIRNGTVRHIVDGHLVPAQPILVVLRQRSNAHAIEDPHVLQRGALRELIELDMCFGIFVGGGASVVVDAIVAFWCIVRLDGVGGGIGDAGERASPDLQTAHSAINDWGCRSRR